MPAPLADRLAAVQEQVAAAARSAGRDPADVTTVVVTKFQPLALIEELHALGVRDFGESRHPEARDKAAALPDATWHFIGQLQTNKARQVARYADVVHSVDRPELVDALAGRELDVLLQVDLGVGEAGGRGGARPGAVPALAERVLEAEGLRLRGVMTVAPIEVPAATAFAALALVAERVRAVEPAATWVSAGMSGDFAEAVAAGATHLRIGSAITGPRPSA
ncbi:YggS family pyridoxal phosphate-dependent enzyme [Amnibacterium setariae]|uniref:Pyridoxal phosphate homeostasis protein n=1 Tax=Amnibacterium setariae TaxID=2306585 RepID=A0A3A1TZM0_9MICO|nr:YggS family pyridoxal phosphate-dependent enzyme [Amnibacterium setariae]RIX27666.1 YggS family pyridoxal phosphate-dependent enzyme [Amnibacterium setariae]